MVLRATLRHCARLPVLVVTAVSAWSYYAYVVQLCLVTLTCTVQKVVYLLMFHVCFVMFCWCFWKTLSTRPTSPSKTFHLSDTHCCELLDRVEEEKALVLLQVTEKLPVHTRSASGAIRFCRHCQLVKPDRSHHCSTCQICVLKMDHHCLWLNNCIGFSNYKFFVLFLLYSVLYCLCVVVTVTPSFVHLWLVSNSEGRRVNSRTAKGTTEVLVSKRGLFDSSAKLHVLFLTLVSAMFLVTLSCLLLFHCWLLAKNKTTLEWLSAPFFPDGPDDMAFDVGVRENILQVFGLDRTLWLLPVSSSQGDGQSFPLRRRAVSHHAAAENGVGCWEHEGIVDSHHDRPVVMAIDE